MYLEMVKQKKEKYRLWSQAGQASIYPAPANSEVCLPRHGFSFSSLKFPPGNLLYLIKMLWRLSGMTHEEHLAQGLSNSISGSCIWLKMIEEG